MTPGSAAFYRDRIAGCLFHGDDEAWRGVVALITPMVACVCRAKLAAAANHDDADIDLCVEEALAAIEESLLDWFYQSFPDNREAVAFEPWAKLVAARTVGSFLHGRQMRDPPQ